MPNRKNDTDADLLALAQALKEIAEQIARGEVTRGHGAQALEDIAKRMKPRGRKRGRPVGARTKAEPMGAKIAREFFDLVYSGIKPTEAARIVGDRWSGISESAIFHHARRHDKYIADEIHAKVAREFLERCPDIGNEITKTCRMPLEYLAEQMEQLGNPVVAAAIRSYAPEFERKVITIFGKFVLEKTTKEPGHPPADFKQLIDASIKDFFRVLSQFGGPPADT